MIESKIPSMQWIRNKIEQLDSDLLREMVKSVAELLMSQEADMRHCATSQIMIHFLTKIT